MTIRLDRATLRSPRLLGDGSLRVEAITSRADAALVYSWGTEVATVEALSDQEYLDALRGLSVTLHHPESGKRQRGDRRVGTVLSARYDADERAVIQEWTIDDPEAIEAVQSGRIVEVSEGYEVPPEHLHRREDGVSEQRRRIPNHVAMTDKARVAGARIRTDEEDQMDKDEIVAMIAEALAPLMERMDAYDAKMREDEEPEDAEEEAPPPERADEIAARIVALHRRADALRVTVPDTARAETEVAAHMAQALGADATRCDSLDYCRGVIDAAKVPSAVEAWGRQGIRADSTHSDPC